MASTFERNRTALVTGASAGIGLEIARQLTPRVETLITVARRVERMQSLAEELRAAHPNVPVVLEKCDLSDTQAISAMCQPLEAMGLRIDILVNNAGLGENTVFETSNWNRTSQILAVQCDGRGAVDARARAGDGAPWPRGGAEYRLRRRPCRYAQRGGIHGVETFHPRIF